MTTARGRHLVGAVLGSCKLEKLLGYGGSSAVFLAQQLQTGEEVAVKVFLPRANMDVQMQKDFYTRFLREAEAASKLDHPNILPIYAYGEQNGLPYIIMPYMPGGTLSEYMAQHGALSLKEALWYLEQITSALDYAHRHGCVHCDVKPANMLLDSTGRLMLSDFGIARVSRTGELSAQVASNNALMGTPDYISPEQAMGRTLDGRSDIYSLGVTLFSLLAKRLPFRADTTIALALQHVHEPPPSLTLIRADISPELDSVVQTALAKDPARRFQTAGAFCEAFARAVAASEHAIAIANRGSAILAGNPGFVSSPSRPPLTAASSPGAKPVARGSMKYLIATAVLLLALIVGGGIAARLILTGVTSKGASKAANSNSISAAINTVTPTMAATDYLSERDDWPSSATFYYDEQQKYHILNKSARNVAQALYGDHNFGDFSLHVDMEEIHTSIGHADYYGVLLRAAADQSRYYIFEIDTTHGGQYAFVRFDGQSDTLATGTISSLAPPGKSNNLVVNVQGNNFIFYVNGKQVGQATDKSATPFTRGQVGLYVEDEGAEVAFSRFYVKAN
ncbi:DUF1080 domain-containing protein [Ktedonosporobacter rubrisoli]|uniref:non-specific serine/threonine protein kinase n=1 Tax=Ktedonosporobacter rubrisoli TaxID=2509675 RepID=A0A4P6K173_KTERU|nr:protein kinase [Ktedonosporobacter rubrisoli]QBD81907.1 DUF1080 domain-containing protein [Ktedonosporobacter rubrisoli]